jgi:hypothetical protein
MKFLGLLLLTPLAFGQSVSGHLSAKGDLAARRVGFSCGPPSYNCSKTTSETVQLPVPFPTMGPAGSVIIDNLSGARIMRLTDANTNYSACPLLSSNYTFVANYSGNDTERTINASSTLIAVGQTAHAIECILSVDPTGFAIRGAVYELKTKQMSFDPSNPNLIWDLEQGTTNCTGLCLGTYDLTGCTVSSCTPTYTKIYDFIAPGNCLAGAAKIGWFAIMGVDSTSTLATFGTSDVGGQDTGSLVVAYKLGAGCRVANIGAVADAGFAAQTIGWADWGSPAGPLTFVNATNPNESSKIHETFNLGNGYLQIGTHNCTPYPPYTTPCTDDRFVWNPGTNQMTAAYFSGHFCNSQNFFAEGGQGGGQFALVDSRNVLGNPSPSTNLIALANLAGFRSPNVPMDQHCSWNNALTSDNTFVFVNWDTVTKTLNGNPIQGTPTDPFAGPYNSEITGYPTNTPNAGIIHRFGHTYASTNNPNFQVEYTDGSVSPRGDIYVFTSDWVDTLGTDAQGNPRGDVFMMELK